MPRGGKNWWRMQVSAIAFHTIFCCPPNNAGSDWLQRVTHPSPKQSHWNQLKPTPYLGVVENNREISPLQSGETGDSPLPPLPKMAERKKILTKLPEHGKRILWSSGKGRHLEYFVLHPGLPPRNSVQNIWCPPAPFLLNYPHLKGSVVVPCTAFWVRLDCVTIFGRGSEDLNLILMRPDCPTVLPFP